MDGSPNNGSPNNEFPNNEFPNDESPNDGSPNDESPNDGTTSSKNSFDSRTTHGARGSLNSLLDGVSTAADSSTSRGSTVRNDDGSTDYLGT